MTKIVVGIDGSEGSAVALRWAAAAATARGWSLSVLLAWGYLDQYHADPADPFDPDYNDAKASAALARRVTDVLGAEAAATAELVTTCDLPSRALVTASTEAGLLVVGSRGRGGFRGLLLGSTSTHCLHHAGCPVAVVREAPVDHGRVAPRIVVGIDGSAGSLAALRWAVAHAAATVGRVEVVQAWHTPYATGAPFAYVPVDGDAIRDWAQRSLDDVMAGIDTSGLALAPEARAVEGGSASVLIDLSQDADLLVVGSRGHGGFAGLLLGSVSDQVTRHAACPVVVVPPDA